MVHTRNVARLVPFLAAAMFVLVGCGGGGSGGSDNGQPPPADLNVSGNWQLSNANMTSNCPSTPSIAPMYGTVTHATGSSTFTISSPDMPTTTGSIDGTTLRFTLNLGNSYGCDSLKGTTSDLALKTTDPGKYESATGTFHFTCIFTGGSCSGSGTLTATKG